MPTIFQKIFKRPKPTAEGETSRADILGGGGNVFTAWSGDAYANDIYRSAVDSIARNAAKLKGSHVIQHGEHHTVDRHCRINRLLQTEPNPYMSVFDLIYKLVTHYYLYNNAFAYLQRDHKGDIAGIYPLNPTHIDFVSNAGAGLYCHFRFRSGKETLLPYGDIIHLRRNFNGGDLLGDSNTALAPILQLAHTQNEGIENSIKSGAHIRGILKRNQISSVAMLKEIQENFVKDHLSIANNGGVAVIDEKSEYIPLNNPPQTVDGEQLKMVKAKIYDYLGVSEKVVNSSYTEDEWGAFYESTLEPLAVQLSLEFTRKIFTEREQAFGNSILFESGRLQYSSTQTKVSLIKELMPYRLFTVNQALEILNLPSVPDGDDIRLQTLNVVDAAKVGEYQESKAGLHGTGRQSKLMMEVTPDE